MAIVLQTKPRYRPRGVVSFYMRQGRLVARSWRRPGPDPRTPQQVAQRGRLACASGFLKHFRSIVQRGFTTGTKPNGRIVGAYQMALAALLKGGILRRADAWRVDYAAVRLAQGRACPLRDLRAMSRSGRLVLSWRGAPPSGAERLSVALYCPSRGKGVVRGVSVRNGSTGADLALPRGFGTGVLHAWIILENEACKILCESIYANVIKVRGIVVLDLLSCSASRGNTKTGEVRKSFSKAAEEGLMGRVGLGPPGGVGGALG